MVALLQHYSLSELFLFMVFLALAIKSLISFFDWARHRIEKSFNIQHRKLSLNEKMERRYQHYNERIDRLNDNQKEIDNVLKNLSTKIDMLVESDKDAIKSFITRQHHFFCYQRGWIDDFNLDCLERRYSHYAEEGGNSFISGFMDELRSLPKQPPQE